MRKIIIYLILVFAVNLSASEIKWSKSYQDGLMQATKENKPMLFVSSRHTCKWCIYLETTTFKDKEVIKQLNESFVSVTSYSDDNDYVPRELYRPGTPAIWFLLPSGEPMFQPLMGALDAPKFLEALKVVKKEFKTIKEAK